MMLRIYSSLLFLFFFSSCKTSPDYGVFEVSKLKVCTSPYDAKCPEEAHPLVGIVRQKGMKEKGGLYAHVEFSISNPDGYFRFVLKDPTGKTLTKSNFYNARNADVFHKFLFDTALPLGESYSMSLERDQDKDGADLRGPSVRKFNVIP